MPAECDTGHGGEGRLSPKGLVDGEGGVTLAQRCSDDKGGLRWSLMIDDAPCRSEG
jgi:hypothetical protein